MLRTHTRRAAVLAVLVSGAVAAQSRPDAGLHITVLEGEGAINNIREHTARAPVIRVVDVEDKPAGGVTVNFLLPEFGPSGTFTEGGTHFTTTTDQDGRATGRGLRPNNVAGRFQIRVSASSGGSSGAATINQVNVAPAAAKSGSKTKYIIAALAAGGAAGAIFALKGGGNGSGSSTPGTGGTTVTPGSPVFGPPR